MPRCLTSFIFVHALLDASVIGGFVSPASDALDGHLEPLLGLVATGSEHVPYM